MTDQETMATVFDKAVEEARESWVRAPWSMAREIIDRQLRERTRELIETPEWKAKIEQIALDAVMADDGMRASVKKEIFGDSSWLRRDILKNAVDAAVKANQPKIDEIFAGLIDERGQKIVEEMFKNMLGSLAQEVAAKACGALFGEIGARTMLAIQNTQHSTRY